MKVKIGELMFDTSKEPVMLIFSDKDLDNIKNMSKGDRCYCKVPAIFTKQDIQKFMRIGKTTEHLPRRGTYEMQQARKTRQALDESIELLRKILDDENFNGKTKSKYSSIINRIILKSKDF